jgi:diguanylate cyclase
VSGRIIGAEALLRWNHPSRGLLTPANFIPIAERTGSIVQIGAWAFDEACRQMNVWQEQGIAPDLLAVNFSAVQFKATADLDVHIAQCLSAWNVRPSKIEIELTESVLLEVTQQHKAMFERLRQIGMRIAIDDFGTGYSSLNYLTNYPLNRLKIAQELMARVISDARSATVVRAAIHLADALGMECIAEGVDSEGQADFLVSAGCIRGQGFYFSRPVNAEHMSELLKEREIRRKRGARGDGPKGMSPKRAGVAAA